MGNVGADIGRAINRRPKDMKSSGACLDRGLELLDLTIADPKNHGKIAELNHMKEVLKSYFYGDNKFGSSDESLEKYFYEFAYNAALERGF